jgi:hypothetical protein
VSSASSTPDGHAPKAHAWDRSVCMHARMAGRAPRTPAEFWRSCTAWQQSQHQSFGHGSPGALSSRGSATVVISATCQHAGTHQVPRPTFPCVRAGRRGRTMKSQATDGSAGQHTCLDLRFLARGSGRPREP